MACTPIVNLRLDEESQAALERIKKKKNFSKIVSALASAGIFNSIFTKSKAPVAAFNITQTDWDLYAQSMASLPRIQRKMIEQEIDLMIIHYQINGYDRNHILFWKGIKNGCK